MSERWEPIPDFEGLYAISDLGRVMSLRRGRILKPGLNTSGYHQVCLFWTKKRKQMRVVGRTVLEAFTGERYDWREMHAAHRNGKRTDNRLANLYWATISENHLDKRKHGTNYIGTRHYAAKLNPEKVREIRKLLAKGIKRAVIAKQYGIRVQSLMALESGRTWFHVKSSNAKSDRERE